MIEEFIDAYIEAIFFTESENIGDAKLTNETRASITKDCQDFLLRADNIVKRVLDHGLLTVDSIAHDFWFTRNGHGCGFWEGNARGYPGNTGDELDTIAKQFGQCDAYRYRGWVYVA